MTERVRVFVVAASGAQRRALETLIERSESLSLLGSGTLVGSVPPHADVVLAEVLPGQEPQQSLSGRPYWVILSDEPRSAWIERALNGAVRAVIPLHSPDCEVELALQAAALGLVVLTPEALPQRASATPATSPLSPREQEVLTFLALGRSNKEIAQKLAISEHTVKFHLTSIFHKLEANSRSEAVAVGIRRGLVSC